MKEENTNWCQSVTGVVIRDGKVLLARHTYGGGKGMLIIPGGYVQNGESPQEALKREFLEETHVLVEPQEIIGIRFNPHDWYIAFYAEYVEGNAESDHDENSEVLWLDLSEVLQRDDVPDLTKKLVQCALKRSGGFSEISYNGKGSMPHSLYGIK